jgi:hypothetical protein
MSAAMGSIMALAVAWKEVGDKAILLEIVN